ncbi:MAG: molybdopterin-synthase adenylyltransferase MoeB [Chitinophagales bacterium]|nr:molybdopterin-synthase adenylyltransferase MoeB [Chitinophagales bacterium]
MELTKEEHHRYSRQISLSELGIEGQIKLKKAKVIVIGAGGLGCSLLPYLAAAGTGTIGIIDGDSIDVTNLHRQVLFNKNEIGKNKAGIAKQKLSVLNPEINIVSISEFLYPENALTILENYDLIIDGSDNFECRYLINDVCVKLDKPFVSGAVYRFTGQVGVFNFNRSGTYRCLFDKPPLPGQRPDCSETGVMGIVPGIVGTLMANEAIKIICGIGEALSGKILNIDFLSMKFQTVSFRRDENAVDEIRSLPLLNSQEYKNICNVSSNEIIKEISPGELKQILDQNDNIQLIDVREPFERAKVHIGGDFIPLGDIMLNVAKISKDKKVIFYCKAGIRSQIAITQLQDKYGFTNLYNLKGGLKTYLEMNSIIENLK